MLTRLSMAAWLFAGCLVCLAATDRGADEFPAKATYLFFTQGSQTGKSDVIFTTENGMYVFTSTSDVAVDGQNHVLSCRSEFDKTSLRPRLFRYKGSRGGESLSGTIKLDQDSVKASLETSGIKTTKRARWVDGTFVFQNYVPEHLSVLARHLATSPKTVERLRILFPSDMMVTPGIASIESELELATRPAPMVCKKYVVSLQNSPPFYLYVDAKRNSLVYMDFPASQTEVFLESAFGAHPETRYSAAHDGGSPE